MSDITGLPSTRWARDEEYNIPLYKEITQEMIRIHADTGSRKGDPQGEHHHASLYAGGLYWSRRWEYPWAIESAGLVKSNGTPIDNIKEMKVLDVGCGHAPFLVYLGQMGCQAYGSDPGAGGPDGLWGVFDPNFGKPHITELRQEGMQDLSWPDNHFDRIFCLSVIEHLPSDQVRAGVERMRRVLKPGGLLVISVDDGLMRDAIIEVAAMPFYGGVDLEPVLSSQYHYFILGMVFQKP